MERAAPAGAGRGFELCAIGHPRALGPILRLLYADDAWKNELCRSGRLLAGQLVLLHGHNGRKELERVLRSGSPDERATAAIALARERHPEAFDALRAELVDGFQQRDWTRLVSGTIARRYPEQFKAWADARGPDLPRAPGVAWTLAQVRLAEGGHAARDLLRAGPPSVRAAAVRKLARDEGAASLAELRRFLREGKPAKVAQEAFWQMLRLGDAALPMAMEMLGSAHWTERKAAVCLLRRWGRLTPEHKARAESDPHIAVRHAAK